MQDDRSEARAQLRTRLEVFYEENDAAKLADLDSLVNTFDGKLGKLTAALKTKYGVGLTSMREVRRGRKATLRSASKAVSAATGAVTAARRILAEAVELIDAAATTGLLPVEVVPERGAALPATVAADVPAAAAASSAPRSSKEPKPALGRLAMLLATEAARDMVTVFDHEDEACGEWAASAPTVRSSAAEPAWAYGMNLRLRSLASLEGFPLADAAPLKEYDRARRASAAEKGSGGDALRLRTARRGATEEVFRAELEAIFKAHDASRLHDSTRLAATYAGRERQQKLLSILARTYGIGEEESFSNAARSRAVRKGATTPWRCVALRASVNRIADIAPCLASGSLVHLRVLDLSANRLVASSFGRDATRAAPMPHLRIVNLANNALASFAGLGVLLHGATQLRSLDLSLNAIESLRAAPAANGEVAAALPALPHLERLDLHGNRMRDLGGFGALSIGTSLRELDLHTNCLCDHLSHRSCAGVGVGSGSGGGNRRASCEDEGAEALGGSVVVALPLQRFAAPGHAASHWTSVAPLGALAGLRSLRLDGNRLSDVDATGSVLHGLASLSVLTACHNEWHVRADAAVATGASSVAAESAAALKAGGGTGAGGGESSTHSSNASGAGAGTSIAVSGGVKWLPAPLVAYRRSLLQVAALLMLDGVAVDAAMRTQVAALAQHERLMAIMDETSEKFVMENSRRELTKEGVVAKLRREIAAAEDAFTDGRKHRELELSRCIGYLESLAVVPADAKLASDQTLLPTAENVFPTELKAIIPVGAARPACASSSSAPPQQPQPQTQSLADLAPLTPAQPASPGVARGVGGSAPPSPSVSAASSSHTAASVASNANPSRDSLEARLHSRGLEHMWHILEDVEMTTRADAALLEDEDLLDLGLSAEEVESFHLAIGESL